MAKSCEPAKACLSPRALDKTSPLPGGKVRTATLVSSMPYTLTYAQGTSTKGTLNETACHRSDRPTLFGRAPRGLVRPSSQNREGKSGYVRMFEGGHEVKTK